MDAIKARGQIATAFALVIYLAASAMLAADTQDDAPFLPVSPEVLAQGGSFIANAHGYNALFYNPAGFTGSEGSLTVLSSTAWLYANPYRAFRMFGDKGSSALVDFMEDEVTSGGFGFGCAGGIGYVGKGIGLGLVFNMDSYLWGPTTLGAEGTLDATLALITGLALPVNLWGIRINLGADLRPMIRVRALEPLDYTVMLDLVEAMQDGGKPLAALNSVEALHGFALAIDLGAIVELGNWKLGLAARDFLGTRFTYAENEFGVVMSSLGKSGAFPEGETPADEYRIPMNLSAGISYHPDFGRFSSVLDPVLHASLDDVIGMFDEDRSPWTSLHFGTEIALFRAVKLRGGFNQGYLTLGGGVELPFLDLNAAFFTREMGKYIGDRPNSGMSLEAAIRF